MERLDKLLANTGRWSRREARELVRQGRVTVDGAAAARSYGENFPVSVQNIDGSARIGGVRRAGGEI